MPLPPSFTSLYRLFLRTSSTSVLHQSLATRNLRSLWRPVFADAAQVITRLKNSQTSSDRETLENWLKNWEEQMDHTLSFLYVSASSRGLSHQLTRNLSQLYHAESERLCKRKYPVWNAQLAPGAREYQIPVLEASPKAAAKELKARQSQHLEDCAWHPLGLVVGMAEGRDKLCLGRIAVRAKAKARSTT
ncbi:hypothetical protein BDP27DRAFT_1238110 [Rhodocollybia butyracea]|uniref:Uncharacterized protein n=1 Tax=Rhodocollybia butyracea TaxID=206335 RepID=A0A9P5P6H0_9AGAR|nr:hypothetical protein BDP27DRAFT_1238110 [Rhodocollybia butyracea]